MDRHRCQVALGGNGLDDEDMLRAMTKGGLAGDSAMLKLVVSPRASWYAQRNSGFGERQAGPIPGTTVAARGSNVIVDMRLYTEPTNVETLQSWLQIMIDAAKSSRGSQAAARRDRSPRRGRSRARVGHVQGR